MKGTTMMHARIVAAAAAIALCAEPALAHPGHEHEAGFVAGLLHPLTGLDHLAAMLAVGLWAGFSGAGRRWVWPAAFLAGMAGGIAIGWSSLLPAGIELAIAATLLALGGALVLRWSPAAAIGAAAVAVAGLVHGVVHGAEMPGSVFDMPLAAGLLVATAGLHALGVVAASRLSGLALAPRVAGLACAGLGLVAAAGALVA